MFAEESLTTVNGWNMPVLFPTHTTLRMAGKLIANYHLGIADSFIAALSIENGVTLVTKDRDFQFVGSQLSIKWIG